MPMIVFTLDETDAQKIVNAVAAQPFRDVSVLMQTLMTQAQSQLSAQAQEQQAGLSGMPGVGQAASDEPTASTGKARPDGPRSI